MLHMSRNMCFVEWAIVKRAAAVYQLGANCYRSPDALTTLVAPCLDTPVLTPQASCRVRASSLNKGGTSQCDFTSHHLVAVRADLNGNAHLAILLLDDAASKITRRTTLTKPQKRIPAKCHASIVFGVHLPAS